MEWVLIAGILTHDPTRQTITGTRQIMIERFSTQEECEGAILSLNRDSMPETLTSAQCLSSEELKRRGRKVLEAGKRKRLKFPGPRRSRGEN